jgi:hypothetical protein
MVGTILGYWAGRLVLARWLEQPTSPGARPAAVLAWTERDFGSVAAGKTLRTELPVTNAGTKSLILLEHPSNCGCRSDGELERTIIDPSRTARLRIEWRVVDQPGPARKQIRFTTNDSRQPLLAVTLHARIQRPGTP